jgi:hypothetical protein
MMAKRPQDRYPSPAAVAAALEPFALITEEMEAQRLPLTLDTVDQPAGTRSSGAADVPTAPAPPFPTQLPLLPQATEKITPPPAWERRVWMLALATVLLVLLAGGAGAWWLISMAVSGAIGRATVADAGKGGQTDPSNDPLTPRPNLSAQAAEPAADDALPRPGRVNNVNIKEENGVHRITTPHYEAVIDRDGCLTSLRVGGIELLWVSGTLSRGAFLLDNGPLKLERIEQLAMAPSIIARNDRTLISYEVLDKGIACRITQNSDKPIPFLFVFASTVRAVNTGGIWMKVPVKESPCPLCTWYAGRSWLKMSGGTRTWAPFEKTHQVWEAIVPPREIHEVLLEVGTASDDEIKQLARVTGE